MLSDLSIVEARTEAQVRAVADLFAEYARALDIDLAFQGFAEELASLPGKYAPPGGAFLLAESGSEPAGCVAVRPWAEDVCEMKRLYVRPAFRNTGLGRRLAEEALAVARRRGYAAMRLDTLASMTSAIALYRSLGFTEIAPYYDNPIPGAVFLEATLRGEERPGSP